MNFKINFAYLFLFLAVLFWAGNFIVGKYASYYEIPPFSLNFYRWFFAWLILLPFTFQEIISNESTIRNTNKKHIKNKWTQGDPKTIEKLLKNNKHSSKIIRKGSFGARGPGHAAWGLAWGPGSGASTLFDQV